MKTYNFDILLEDGTVVPIEQTDAVDRNEAFRLAADFGTDSGWAIKSITYTGESS